MNQTILLKILYDFEFQLILFNKSLGKTIAIRIKICVRMFIIGV